ncbi:DUF4097 domain-containing protein [Rheinheimera marina]|uniref:DUF4097 domain-containing protein n=1 Tax=Rheinheimera marina TaxID=1774958 RepID=A0ABV9JKG4_9GAMM
MKHYLVVTGLVFAMSQAWAAESINESRAVAANEKIFIENMRGYVEIRAVDAKEFKVSGTLDEKADGYTLESKNGFTTFKVKMPTFNNFNGGDNDQGSKLTIDVPKGAELEFQGVNSDVTVKGIQGSTKITSVNGKVDASALRQFVQLQTVNGEIDSRDNQGKVSISTVNGAIKDTGSAGRLELDAVNGEISSSTTAKEVRVSVVNGEADLKLDGVEQLSMSAVNGGQEAQLKNSLSPRVDVSTVSGGIKLTLEKNISAKFNLVANAGGSIRNNLTSDKAERSKYGPRSSLEFSTGKGEGNVEMSTVSGSLKVDTF